MSIPASHIVQVNPRLLTPGGTDLEFNGLLLSASDSIPSGSLVLPFGDAASVGDYFGLESAEYNLAVIYFAGYDNSFAKPRALYIARRVAEDAAAFLRGGAFGMPAAQTLASLKSVSEGELTLSIGAHEDTLTGLDFSGANALSDVAGTLQTAIRARTEGGADWTTASVEYSSLFDAFIITSGTSGAESGITHASGAAAGPLKLTLDSGAVTSQGMDAMTQIENMEAVLEVTQNWVCFTTVDRPTREDALAYAEWSAGKGVNYLYVYWDNDPKLLQPNNTQTIAAALKEQNAGAVAGVWDSAEYAAMILGTAASIDWERRNGVITFAFKKQSGLAANVANGTDAVNLDAQGMNFMGDYATRNDQFIFLYPGRMFGDWAWIDPYLNAVWLNNALQTAIMAGFAQCPRVPYTDAGYTLVKAWCQDPINRALRSGIIDPGVTLSESQKAQLFREAGRDISGELFTDGYVLQVRDPAPAVRQKRDTPECSLWYTYGGSIHKLTLAGTAVV